MKPIENDVAKQNKIAMIVQFLQGSKEFENNVQLKKSESNTETINKSEGEIPLQMRTSGGKNIAISKVSNKRPNENAQSFNQPIKKMKVALNTNPNSRQDATVPNTGELKVRQQKEIKVKTDQGNVMQEQSTKEVKLVEDQQNKNIMMKVNTINTKKDFPNSAEYTKPTVRKVRIILLEEFAYVVAFPGNSRTEESSASNQRKY